MVISLRYLPPSPLQKAAQVTHALTYRCSRLLKTALLAFCLKPKVSKQLLKDMLLGFFWFMEPFFERAAFPSCTLRGRTGCRTPHLAHACFAPQEGMKPARGALPFSD